jgi:hypothetical protein
MKDTRGGGGAGVGAEVFTGGTVRGGVVGSGIGAVVGPVPEVSTGGPEIGGAVGVGGAVIGVGGAVIGVGGVVGGGIGGVVGPVPEVSTGGGVVVVGGGPLGMDMELISKFRKSSAIFSSKKSLASKRRPLML